MYKLINWLINVAIFLQLASLNVDALFRRN